MRIRTRDLIDYSIIQFNHSFFFYLLLNKDSFGQELSIVFDCIVIDLVIIAHLNNYKYKGYII